jgi:hypothetical protein
LSEQKPLLVVIADPMGAGKTTFYDAHLKEAFPALIPPISHQREAAYGRSARLPLRISL